MKLPDKFKTELPFFAYGLFKPGQLCFFRIRDLVKEKRPAEVNGCLKERDGLPLLVLDSYQKIKGFLIRFKDGQEKEAYERIVEIEPDAVYHWKEIDCLDNTRANSLLGKRSDRGSSDLEDIDEWNGRDDPFFREALDEVEAIIKDNSKFTHSKGDRWDYKTLFRLEMAYSLLWSAIERYTGLKYHLGGEKVTEKVNNIAKESVFINSLKKHVKRKAEIYRADDLDKCCLDPCDPEKSLKYYYQVRCNAAHRGKAAIKDFDTIKDSLEELLPIFRDLINESFKNEQ